MKVKIPTVVIESINNNLDSFLQDSPILFNVNMRQKEKLFNRCVEIYYFIYDKNMELRDINNYRNISREKFTEMFKKIKIKGKYIYYSDILGILSGVIQVNEVYSPGNFSKSYRIRKDIFKSSSFTEIEIDLSIIYQNVKSMDYWLTKYPQHRIEILNHYTLKLNLDEVIGYMYNNHGMEMKPVMKKTSESFERVLTKRYLDTAHIFQYTNSILKFYFKNIWFKESDEGRLYSSITTIPYIIRPFLTYEGRYLEEVDIVNSQITILASIIGHKGFKDAIEDETIDIYTILGNGDRHKGKGLTFSKILFNDKSLLSGELYDTLELNYPGLIGMINTLKKETKLYQILQKKESEVFIDILSKMEISKYCVHDSTNVFPEDVEKMKNIIREIYWVKFNIKVQLD